jgi:hypothetical protein
LTRCFQESGVALIASSINIIHAGDGDGPLFGPGDHQYSIAPISVPRQYVLPCLAHQSSKALLVRRRNTQQIRAEYAPHLRQSTLEGIQ